jgi:hypothetical protein
MALTEQTTIGKIEIVGEYKSVQVRTDTIIMRDGVEISRNYHRHVMQPGQDYSNEDASVQAVCAAVHTPEIIAAFVASQETNQ